MRSLITGKYLVLAGLTGLSMLVGCVSSDSSADETEEAYALRSTLSGSSDGKKTYVCHIPPGNPANAHTIHVGNPAVDAHLAHGDSLGRCDQVLTPDSGSAANCHGKGKGRLGRKSIQNVVQRSGHSWKVTLCHLPPGNPENAHTLSVGAAAVRAHLAHGDVLGACADSSETAASSMAPDCREGGSGGTGTGGSGSDTTGTGGSGTGGSGTDTTGTDTSVGDAT